MMRQIPHGTDIAHLVPVVLEAAGLPRGRVVRERGGIGNHVYRVGRQYIVRLGTGSDAPEFGKSCDLLRAFHGTLPCPELLFGDPRGELVGLPAMVCAYIEGRNLQRVWPGLTPQNRRAVFEEVLALLPAIHGYDWRTLDAFREMGGWAETRRGTMAVAMARAREDRTLDQKLVENYARFWEEHSVALDAVEAPVLLHNDVHVGNVIVDDRLGVRGLLDFDDAEVSPPEIEYWNIADELLDREDAPPFQEIREMLAPYFNFAGEEARIRYLLNETYWHLITLTEGVSWRSAASSRRSAAECWQENFVEGRVDHWFQPAPEEEK